VLLGCDAAKTNGSNVAKFCYQPFEDLIQKAKSITKPADRDALYKQAQVIFKEQAPWFTIAHAVQLKPVRKEVIDFKLSPFGRHNFYGVDIKSFGLHSPKVHRGLLVSGDRFVSTAIESEALRRSLPDALAVEMEGAAVAQACRDYGVPFVAMRTISDRADDEAHGDFARFVVEVASRYSLALVDAWLATRPAVT
jgi:nucleoside phosphorylase